MTHKKAMIDIGWNFENSYAKLPESFLPNKIPRLCAHRS